MMQRTFTIAERWIVGLAVFLAAMSMNAVEFQPADGGEYITANVKTGPLSKRPVRNFIKEPSYHNAAPRYIALTIGNSFDSLICGAIDGPSADVYDTLYLDANGNGDLTDDPPLPLKRKGSGSDAPLYSDPVSVLVRYFSGAERKLRVVVRINTYAYDTGNSGNMLKHNFSYEVVDHMEGQVDLGGKKVLIGLYDCQGNRNFANGCFSDIGVDRLRVDLDGDGKLEAPAEDLVLSKIFQFSDKFWEISADSEAAEVRVNACKLAAGNIRFQAHLADGAHVENSAVKIRSAQIGYLLACRISMNSSLTVAEGEYDVGSPDLVIKDAAGSTWMSSFSFPSKLVIQPGAETVVNIGAPVTVVPAISGSAKPGQRITVSARVNGIGGEEYGAFHCGERSVAPHVKITDVQNALVTEGNMEFS